nr:Toll/interleukin-1 receptor (TIR) domain-containing protein [Tanacetum cinerariifolium]
MEKWLPLYKSFGGEDDKEKSELLHKRTNLLAVELQELLALVKQNEAKISENALKIKKELPDEIGHLESLKELDITGANICHLPQSIFRINGLRIVGDRWLFESCGLIHKLQRIIDDDDDDDEMCYSYRHK